MNKLVIVFVFLFVSCVSFNVRAGLLYGSQTYDFVSHCGALVNRPPSDLWEHPDWIFVGTTYRPDYFFNWMCDPHDNGNEFVGVWVGAHEIEDGDVLSNWKSFHYYLGNPIGSPPPLCSVLNPIELANGAKIQKELDINPRGKGQVFYERFYNNTNQPNVVWHHTYENSVTVLEENKHVLFKPLSQPYNSKEDACSQGWAEIGPAITESWAAGATAKFVNSSCQIIRNGVVVKTLPILTDPAYSVFTVYGPVQLGRSDGSIYTFQKDAQGNYYSLNGEVGVLVLVGTNGIKWRYFAENGDIEDYSEVGKLLSITNVNGVKTSLFYDASSGNVVRAEDSLGKKLFFTYTNNLLTGVTTDDNKATVYSYNSLGLLIDVKRPDNTHRLYHYEDSRFPKNLTGITDERNVRYATWTYDAQGRAITSQHAGGAEYGSISYNADGSSTLTNSLNKQTIYRFDDIAGVRRVVKVEGQPTASCVGANQNYTYTPEGWIASKTDWNGNKTSFTYNAKGQEITRIEADGTPQARSITTEWHPSLYVKTKVTEPNRETTYSYDANGLLLNQQVRSLTAQ